MLEKKINILMHVPFTLEESSYIVNEFHLVFTLYDFLISILKRDKEVHFAKIHAPIEVLKRYADILKIRMPMREVCYSNSLSCLEFWSILSG